ncbi:MAG: hypothetical protein HC819_22885 [Cyclobacteriaceae bacterium]|nr:hypothetical protein [Cyclobacteriaceae bacterium]
MSDTIFGYLLEMAWVFSRRSTEINESLKLVSAWYHAELTEILINGASVGVPLFIIAATTKIPTGVFKPGKNSLTTRKTASNHSRVEIQ